METRASVTLLSHITTACGESSVDKIDVSNSIAVFTADLKLHPLVSKEERDELEKPGF